MAKLRNGRVQRPAPAVVQGPRAQVRSVRPRRLIKPGTRQPSPPVFHEFPRNVPKPKLPGRESAPAPRLTRLRHIDQLPPVFAISPRNLGEARDVMRGLAHAGPGGSRWLPPSPGMLVTVPAGSPLVIWGVLHGCGEILREAIATSMPYYFVDRAYFHRGNRKQKNTRYRITYNRMQAGEVVPRPADRWQALKIELQPLRPAGDAIIVCPPTEFVKGYFGKEAEDWLPKTLAKLQQHTDRPIVVREKPRAGASASPQPPLEEQLRTAWALVTYNSNVAVEAVVAGVPVFTTRHSAAAPVANLDLAQIEQPLFPDRLGWCYHLAYSQFALHEILSGDLWNLLCP